MSSTYTPERILAIKREFARRIGGTRDKQKYMFIAVGIAVMLAAAVMWFVPSDYKNPVILGLVIAGALGVFALVKLYPPVKCPGCEKQLEDAWGAYCPECGSVGLKVIDQHYEAVCANCERSLKYSGKGFGSSSRRRLYRIRACTHCGVSFGRNSI